MNIVSRKYSLGYCYVPFRNSRTKQYEISEYIFHVNRNQTKLVEDCVTNHFTFHFFLCVIYLKTGYSFHYLSLRQVLKQYTYIYTHTYTRFILRYHVCFDRAIYGR